MRRLRNNALNSNPSTKLKKRKLWPAALTIATSGFFIEDARRKSR